MADMYWIFGSYVFILHWLKSFSSLFLELMSGSLRGSSFLLQNSLLVSKLFFCFIIWPLNSDSMLIGFYILTLFLLFGLYRMKLEVECTETFINVILYCLCKITRPGFNISSLIDHITCYISWTRIIMWNYCSTLWSEISFGALRYCTFCNLWVAYWFFRFSTEL